MHICDLAWACHNIPNVNPKMIEAVFIAFINDGTDDTVGPNKTLWTSKSPKYYMLKHLKHLHIEAILIAFTCLSLQICQILTYFKLTVLILNTAQALGSFICTYQIKSLAPSCIAYWKHFL